MVKFFTRFNSAPAVSLKFEEQSMTDQSFAEDADINQCLKKYGSVENYNAAQALAGVSKQGVFADVSAMDFEKAQALVNDANAEFAQLPSDIRDYFNNNPSILLEFLANPDNKAEAIRLGLIEGEAIDEALTQKAGVVDGAPDVLPKSE